MNVLITGGAGFIGSHLAERLIHQDNNNIVIIDDVSTGSVLNIQHLRQAKNLQYYLDSVTNQSLMAELVDAADIIYHLAAAVGVRLIVEKPTHTMETNIRGTEVVLELAAKKKKRVLITSTSEVYGKRSHVPFREGDDLILGPPDKARWSYACSKLIDEILAIAYWKEQKVPTVVVRMFNVVGPRQTGSYGMVLPNFVAQSLTGADLTVYGDGSQTRCFTHVSDAVDALIAIAEHPEANGEIYNIGSIEEISILNLARKIKEMTASESKIVMIPYERAYDHGFEDMMRRVPDLTKIENLIGYRPSWNLEDILLDTINYHIEKPAITQNNGHGQTSRALSRRTNA